MIKEIVIKYKPNSEHQRKFHASDAYERALIAGFGSGKTMAGASEHLKLCAINSGLSSMIISPSYPMAKKTVIPTFIDLLDNSKIQYTYNKSEHTFRIADFKHTVFVGSAEIPNSLKGANLTHVWTDELSIFPVDAYKQGIARVREPLAKKLALIHTMTPELMTWVYDEFILGKRSNRELIFGRTTDNPALPDSYVENLKSRYSEEMQAMYLEGQFVFITDRMVIPEWRADFAIDLEREEEYKFYHHYVAADWGVRDKTALLFATWDFKRHKLIIEGECTLTNKDVTNSNIARVVRAKSAELWKDAPVYRYIGDNNLQVINDLNIDYKIPFVSTDKTDLFAMVNSVRELTKSGQLIVSPSCKEMIGNLRSGIWDKHFKSFERTEAYGHFDLLAALIYLNRNLDKRTNPIPENFYWKYQQNQMKSKLQNNPLAAGMGLKPKKAVRTT